MEKLTFVAPEGMTSISIGGEVFEVEDGKLELPATVNMADMAAHGVKPFEQPQHLEQNPLDEKRLREAEEAARVAAAQALADKEATAKAEAEAAAAAQGGQSAPANTSAPAATPAAPGPDSATPVFTPPWENK